MLQMKCPKCETIISSPFLVEIGSITCNRCSEDVLVEDVFITTRGFTMHRDDLLARVLHYRALLKDLEREKVLIRNSGSASDEAQKSLDQFYDTLRELLAGARENFRLKIAQDFPLDIELANKKGKGRLLDLSTRGAAIRSSDLKGFPTEGSELKLHLALPDVEEPLSMSAEVAWVGKRDRDARQDNATLGVRFKNLNEQTQNHLWEYIYSTQENSRVA